MSSTSAADVGLAIYASVTTDLDLIFDKVKNNFDHIHFDLIDSTFSSRAAEVDLEVITRAHRFWPKRYSMLHIMSTAQAFWAERCVDLVDVLLFHVDSLDEIGPLLTIVKGFRKKAGIVLHNKYFLDEISIYLTSLDFICILAIDHPGVSGQLMRTPTVSLCHEIKKLGASSGPKLIVDGGVNDVTARELPADYLVTSSALLNSTSAEDTYRILKQARTIGHLG
jgi:pentose-5-phosphate-3-epimerase